MYRTILYILHCRVLIFNIKPEYLPKYELNEVDAEDKNMQNFNAENVTDNDFDGESLGKKF